MRRALMTCVSCPKPGRVRRGAPPLPRPRRRALRRRDPGPHTRTRSAAQGPQRNVRRSGHATAGLSPVPGGWVAHCGWVADARGARIRLDDREGRTVSADVHSGVAILTWAEGEFAGVATTELLEASGNVIAVDIDDTVRPPSR